tara:strand:- start:156 stop:563 length:408 start_codon:yes stop_codon:yes gene_type:complete
VRGVFKGCYVMLEAAEAAAASAAGAAGAVGAAGGERARRRRCGARARAPRRAPGFTGLVAVECGFADFELDFEAMVEACHASMWAKDAGVDGWAAFLPVRRRDDGMDADGRAARGSFVRADRQTAPRRRTRGRLR